MSEYDRNGNYLAISQEALTDLYYDFARILVLKGETNDEADIRPTGQPHSFKYKLNSRTAKDIFLSSSADDNLVAIGGYVEYSQLQSIEDPPHDEKAEVLYISIDSFIRENPGIIQHKVITISHDERHGSEFKSQVDVQYGTFDGRSLSYMVEDEGTEEEQMLKAFDAYSEGFREFTVDEFEQLKNLLNFLDEAPHQRES